MEQSWSQPQEPTPEADSLPLAGLLAELLASTEADSAPPPEDDPIAALAQASGRREAPPEQVLRSLGEAAPPPSIPAEDLSGLRTAGLQQDFWAGHAIETAGLIPEEPVLEAPPAPQAVLDEPERPVAAGQDEVAAGEAGQRQAGTAEDLAARMLARFAEELGSQPVAGAAAPVADEPALEAAPAPQAVLDEPDWHAPAEPGLLAEGESPVIAEAGIVTGLSESVQAETVAGEWTPALPEPVLPAIWRQPEDAPVEEQSFGWIAEMGGPDPADAANVVDRPHWHQEPVGCAEANKEEGPAAGLPDSGTAAGPSGFVESAAVEGALASPVARGLEEPWTAAESEDDEFELVDAAQAEKMLDRLLDAARTAIRAAPASAAAEIPGEPAEASPPALPAEQPGALKRSETEPAAAKEEPAAAPAVAGRGEAERAGGLMAASGPGFRETAQQLAEDRAGELSPIPPAVALMALGLPERLRARLESLGDVERILQSQPALEAAPEQQRRLLVFQAGGEWYALSMESVREVERVGRVTPVPGAPPFVRGLVNLRGEILPLLDMAALTGRKEARPASRLIVAQASAADPLVALLVEELNGLAPFEEARVEPPPQPGPVRGSLEHRGRRVWWLDPVAVFGAEALEKAAGVEAQV